MDGAARRPSILIVDDCGDQRDLYALLLASEFDVIGAGRGEEAIALAAERRPDVIVLDIEMPGIDGFETCRRLKADRSTASIPVVMLTGSRYEPADSLVAGAFAVLEKPCPDRTLVDTIVAAIIGAP
jgi:two-component system cell cycle response regulator